VEPNAASSRTRSRRGAVTIARIGHSVLRAALFPVTEQLVSGTGPGTDVHLQGGRRFSTKPHRTAHCWFMSRPAQRFLLCLDNLVTPL